MSYEKETLLLDSLRHQNHAAEFQVLLAIVSKELQVVLNWDLGKDDDAKKNKNLIRNISFSGKVVFGIYATTLLTRRCKLHSSQVKNKLVQQRNKNASGKCKRNVMQE